MTVHIPLEVDVVTSDMLISDKVVIEALILTNDSDWNGTNLYARLYNSANATYQDVCLTNCGSGSPAPDPSPTTVVGPAPTTVVGTVVVGTVVGTVVVGTVVGTVVVGSPPAACDPPCPQDFICIDNSIFININR